MMGQQAIQSAHAYIKLSFARAWYSTYLKEYG